jgi:hypothetical protein
MMLFRNRITLALWCRLRNCRPLFCPGEARVVASGRLGQTFLIGSAEPASAPGRAGAGGAGS